MTNSGLYRVVALVCAVVTVVFGENSHDLGEIYRIYVRFLSLLEE